MTPEFVVPVPIEKNTSSRGNHGAGDYYRLYPGDRSINMVEYLQLVTEFARNPRAKTAACFEAGRVARMLGNSVDGIQLIFGSGHPFIILDMKHDLGIPEMDRYYLQVLQPKAQKLTGGLVCPTCLDENKPVLDFGQHCVSCSSPMGAIDVVRALKDVDIIAIVDHVDAAVLHRIQDVIQANGYVSPNDDLSSVIRSTASFMRGVLEGKSAEEIGGYLHADVVVTDAASFTAAYESIARGDLKNGSIVYQTCRGGVWVECVDELPEDIFMSGPYPLWNGNPLLLSHLRHCVRQFAGSGTAAEVFATYFSYLEMNTDGKYSRMIRSSPTLQQQVIMRIDRATRGDIYCPRN